MQITESEFNNQRVMDHRFSRRYPVIRDIWLTHNDGEPDSFRTRNICHDGMYIETGHTDLQPGQILTATLPAAAAGAAMQPFEVVVMHHTGSGIGVLLTGNDIDLLELLRWPETGTSANLMKMTATGHAPREHCPPGSTGNSGAADSTVVHLYRHRAGGDAVVTLDAGSVLDLRCAGPVQRIRELARHRPISRVIIDLGRTLRIQDSGLAILLLLKRRLGSRLCEIRLINSSAAMRNRLALLPAGFIID